MYSGSWPADKVFRLGWYKDSNGVKRRRSPDQADRERFASSTQKIVDRLLQGPATNAELSKISLKYTSRISDARKRGYQITCTRKDSIGTGLTEYRIVAK